MTARVPPRNGRASPQAESADQAVADQAVAEGGSAAPPRRRGDHIQSLASGLAILALFTDETHTLGIGEMARQLGLHRSTTSRLAATMSNLGYLAPTTEPGRYRLGRQLVRLGALAAQELDLRKLGAEALRPVVDELGETAHLGVLEGRDVMTIVLVDGWHPVRLHSSLGSRAPAHCSSMGKTLLAGLNEVAMQQLYQGSGRLEKRTNNTIDTLSKLGEELARIRERGYAIDNEELYPDLRCIGAPVMDRKGSVVAGLSVSGPVTRLHDEVFDRTVGSVRYVAFQLSLRLGCPAEKAHWADRPQLDSVPPSIASALLDA